MIIVGVDYHPSVQQVAFLDTETGETGERRLSHSDGEAERFYRDLQRRQVKVRVGIEATGHARWFERLLAELKFELWIGDPARIKAARVRKQKTDRQDAQLLLRLLIEGRFPWGDAFHRTSGVDLRRTTPPITEIVDFLLYRFSQNHLLCAIQVYEVVLPVSMADLRARFDWSTLRIFHLNTPRQNHGILLGTKDWAPQVIAT